MLKNKIYLKTLLAICLCAVFQLSEDAGFLAAQKSQADRFTCEIKGSRDVLNLYFTYINRNRNNTEAKKIRDESLKDLKVRDIKNGYLRFSSKYQEGHEEVALFREKEGANDYLFINLVGCGPGCSSDLTILKITGNIWEDVTDKAFPKLPAAIEDEGYYLSLPRYGTNIILKKSEPWNDEKHPGKILFDKGKFIYSP